MAPFLKPIQPDSKQPGPEQTNLQKAFSPVISSQDRGFLYGDGVFETVRYRGGRLLLWALHRDRLVRSCETLVIPLREDVLDQIVSESIEFAPAADCILKIIVTRGEGGRGYVPPISAEASVVLQWHALPADIAESSRQGIDCIICDHPLSLNPVTAGIKHLNRLDQVMASLQLRQAAQSFPAIREGLMCDVDGNVIEGTRSNIFAVIDNRLCTPDLSRAGVQGVARSFLSEQFSVAGIALEVRHISQQELRLASELFVCNSVLGVWPVNRILFLENNAASVQVQFPSRQMADIAGKALQEIFSL
ncbi:MAG: aminodeoxychorismate lyase [Pseudohongiella sp.]|nr:aminodeoxychorismate lyase [Pseudohongiella sp.]